MVALFSDIIEKLLNGTLQKKKSVTSFLIQHFFIQAYQNGETEEDPEQFLNALNSSVEIFVNRMRSNSQRGRSIATDSSVQSLFNVISNMHPQLMKYVQGQEDLRGRQI